MKGDSFGFQHIVTDYNFTESRV